MSISFSWRAGHRYLRPGPKKMRTFLTSAALITGLNPDQITVSFLAPDAMAEVNEQFLSHKGSTDVICFNYGVEDDVPSAGEDDREDTVSVELLVCPAVAERESTKRNLPYGREVALYVVHGMLHAAGYDDLKPELKRKMRAAERRVMGRLEKDIDFSEVFRLSEENEVPE